MARARVSFHPSVELSGFEVLSAPAGSHAAPAAVPWEHAMRAAEARPVAALLEAHSALDWERPPPLDAEDHWYRTTLPALPGEGRAVLVCEGLATLAEIYVEGQLALTTQQMFVPHELELGEYTAGAELALCFRSLNAELAKRRPRPRYRTRIVEAQQLRYLRTSLLGRTPGFAPSLPMVGPYTPIRVERRTFVLRDLHVEAAVEGKERGRVRVTLAIDMDDPRAFPSEVRAVLAGEAGEGSATLFARTSAGGLTLSGELALDRVRRWWPHTHGAQPLSALSLEHPRGLIELGRVGFRAIALDRGEDGRGFGVTINDTRVFARGACWTTDDLTRGRENPREALTLARNAGMNMLRVTGITDYETDAFYDACDELGILLFQDFMFANMDYPASDPAFVAAVEREAQFQLQRLAGRPSCAVLCGGSEVEQQAAMLGLPREDWSSSLFDEVLPRIAAEYLPDVPYVPSTPHGGDLPFQADHGITHYYGVGAYLRPLDDARRADVRFAAECLAFANVPCTASIERFMRDLEPPFHHPRWKQRVPRDRGANWDFEDVRDHYIGQLFGLDPRVLRYTDMERYLALGHAAVGEVMTAVFSEWRREGSRCRGGLVFWYKDLWPGAGWGVVDAYGVPKSAYYYLKRVFAPRTVTITDEGLNGLALHVSNDREEPLAARLELTLLRAGETAVASGAIDLTVPPRSARSLRANAMLPHFRDVTYAYRFGPPGHELTVASLVVAGEGLAQAFHFPLGLALPVESELGLSAHAELRGGRPGVVVSTRRFAQCATLEVEGFLPDDDFFHLAPGASRFIALKPLDGRERVVRGTVGALNARTRVPIVAGG